MLNFLKSVFLAALVTIPIFAITLPIQTVVVESIYNMYHGNGLAIDFAEWFSVQSFLEFAILGGYGGVFALFFGSIGALIVDKFIMPNGGSKIKYGVAGSIVGLIGSGWFAFIFAVPTAIAGFVAGWVYSANRMLVERSTPTSSN